MLCQTVIWKKYPEVMSLRKVKLIKQNEELFSELENLRRKNSDLEEELKSLKKEIEELKSEKSDTVNPLKTPIEHIEDKVADIGIEENASQYGAKAIGRIVVSQANAASHFSDESGSSREKLNLILGKAEVSKAEILKAVSEDADFNLKKVKIDSIVQKTLEYFSNISAK